MMKTSLRVTVILLTMLGCVGCDQVTKSLAREHLPFNQPVSILGDTVRLQLTENPGAFLSLGASLPEETRGALFTAGGMLLLTLAIWWTLRGRRMNVMRTVGAALICSGGLGNLIDRFRQGGEVTDFLNVGVSIIRTGIFNVADMALMCGIVVLLVARAPPSPGGNHR
jgi:signal peptidase II